ncbi:MAG: C69 family dipeptidase [Bacteroidota bacterium]|nr:C69 family dipeptidase [Bacteroidota bacterium]
MNKKALSLILGFLLITGIQSIACTNFLVTKGASTDGSTFITYAADSHVLYGELYFWPTADYPAGTMSDVYEWDTGKFLGKIKQVEHTYSVIGNMNEHQVSIGETTYGGRPELSLTRPGQIIDYGTLMYVTLQRAKTAREAMKIMAELLDEYGFYSVGESFSVADPNEVWIWEMIGKGGIFKIEKSKARAVKAILPSNLYKVFLKEVLKKEFYSQGLLNKAIAEAFKKADPKISEENIKKYTKQLAALTSKEWENGAVWVARLIPDGYISGHANQARITTFPQSDKNNWFDKNQTTFHSSDVVSFARGRGWFNGNDKDFSFSDTYAPVGFGGARFCEIRVWSFFKSVNSKMDKYLPYASGVDIQHGDNGYANNRMPLWIKPDKKIAVHDMMNFMRDHLEDTEYDMTKDLGAGPFGNPYRWRPLTWKVDGVAYCNERATATQQTGFSFVSQMRSWLPAPIGGIHWFSVDDAASTVYFPMYCGATEVPFAYKEGNGSMMEFTNKAAFWVFNQVSNLVYTRWNYIHPEVHKKQQALEEKYIATVAGIDKIAADYYKSDKEKAIEFITDYSCQTGDALVIEWKMFYQQLFPRFMDGNIKEANEIPEGQTYTPCKVNQPGYSKEHYKNIIKDTGDKFKVHGAAH